MAIALLVSTFAPFLVSQVQAATLTQTMVRFDRHLVGTVVTWSVCFRPSTSTASTNVVIGFPDTFTVDTTIADYTTAAITINGSTGLAGLSANATAASNTNGSKSVTFTYTSASLSTSTTYCFTADNNATTGLTTPASAANNVTGTLSINNTAAETGAWGASFVNGSSNFDQWTVGAVVPQLFTYTGPGTSTDNFTVNLDPNSTTSTTGKTVNIKTNAPNGYYVWAKDLNTGLTSAARSKTIAATTPGVNVASCPAGAESYTSVVSASVGTAGGTGTPTANAVYSANCGSGLNTVLAMIESSNGTSNGDNITILEKANITNGTPAASDYTDTVTVVAAGVF